MLGVYDIVGAKQYSLPHKRMLDQPGSTNEDRRLCIPLRLYGDGADAQQHFEIFTMLPVLSTSSSTLDSRILLSVRNCDKTTVKAREDILQTLAWSFESLRISI